MNRVMNRVMNRALRIVFAFLLVGFVAVACGGHHDHDRDDDDHGHHDDHVTITDAVAHASGIAVAAAGPAVMAEWLPLSGRVAVDPEARRSIRARFPGVVRQVRVSVGDRVEAGATLARIEADESLRVYDITAPIGGIVTARRVNPGEAADSVLFELADLSALRGELTAFPRDRARIRAGMSARMRGLDDDAVFAGRVVRVDPFVETGGETGGEANGAARVWLRPDDGVTLPEPGMPLTAEILIAETSVELAVPLSALQAIDGASVVFEKDGEDYHPRPLRLGRRNGEFAEVLGGLDAGADIVVRNSYLIKADLGKAGADHDH